MKPVWKANSTYPVKMQSLLEAQVKQKMKTVTWHVQGLKNEGLLLVFQVCGVLYI